METVRSSASDSPPRFRQRYLALIVASVALMVLVLTWVSIRKSRSDSLALLVRQGSAFTEALAQASENAIVAESYYERLMQRRCAELVTVLMSGDDRRVTTAELQQFAAAYGLPAIYLFGPDTVLITGAALQRLRERPPDFVTDEVAGLLRNPEPQFTLRLEPDSATGESLLYYTEISNRLDRVVVLALDAAQYVQALTQTGIGHLAERMAREEGVEYIMYQSPRGLIFAAGRRADDVSLDTDSFLVRALESDTVQSRTVQVNDDPVLELVRPFANKRYPFGLFRVGMSLEKYHDVARGFDQLMLLLASALFALVVAIVLYGGSRRERLALSRRYSDIKGITDRVLEQLRAGVAVVDPEGIIRLTNAAWNQMFGLMQVLGQRWAELPVLAPLKLEEFRHSGVSADEIELGMTVKQTAKTFLVTRALLPQENGSHSIVLLVYDITGYKEFERQAARRQRLSEMGDLAAGVAHEIRNPLNAIAIAAQRLGAEFEPGVNTDEYRQMTRGIVSETGRLNAIITRFLALARENQSKKATVNLDDFIAQTASTLRLEADQAGIDLQLSLPSGLTVTADPDALRQVLLNLFANSREALGGKPGTIKLSAHRETDRVIIQFEDSGPGIPVELREKVFTPYFTTKESGTGLGLPTVHRIITEMGGEVTVAESALGGAALSLTLPISQ